jgi:hypothetical protein
MCSAPTVRTSRDWLALAGIISPAILAATTLVVASRHPEYSHLRHTLSELGTVGGEGARWMNLAGIIPAGLLVAVAALPVFRLFGSGPLSQMGALVLAMAGLSLAGTAFVPLVNGPEDLTARQGIAHLSLAIVGLAGLALAPLLFALHARRQRSASGWFWPSLAAAIGTFVCAASMGGTFMTGLSQRAALAAFYAWLVAVCLRTLRGRTSPS